MSIINERATTTFDDAGGNSYTASGASLAAEGNLLILSHAVKNGDRSYLSGLAGWTLIDEGSAGSTDTYLASWYKFAGVSESNPTITFNASGSVGQEVQASITEWSGVDGTTPIDVSAVLKSSFGKQQAINTVTTTTDNTLQLVITSNDSNEGYVIEQTTTEYTEVVGVTGASGANSCGHSIFSQLIPTATTTDADIFELTNQGGGNETINTITLALRPSVSTVDITSTTDPVASGSTISTVGTGFESAQGTGGVTQEQDAVVVALAETSWSDLLVESTSPDIESTQLRYGESTLRVTVDSGDDDTILFNTNPVSGRAYTDLVSIHPVPSERLQSLPDLAIDDEVAYQAFLSKDAVVTSYFVVVNDDATYSVDGTTPDGTYTFETKAFDDSDKTWGAAGVETVTISGGVPVTGGARTRNAILADIVVKAGGTVTNPDNRNSLLQDWLDAL